MKILLGFLVAFGIGVFCRVAKIPSPAPQAIVGGLLVVTMSVGYVVANRMIERLERRVPAQQASPLVQERTHESHSVQQVR